MANYIWSGDHLKDIRVIDGDTIEVQFDLGFKIWTLQVLRFARINCAEKKDTIPYLKAKEFVEESLRTSKEIKIVTYYKGKFGRYLCDVFCDGVNLNNLLLEKGLANLYEQNKKRT
jgi:micrococcal nuclease